MLTHPAAFRHPKIKKGLRETAPMLLAVIPLATSYGATGIAQGENGWLLLLSSMLIFAGSAQLMALGLIAADSPLWLILLTTLIINSRHLLYATSLIQPLKNIPDWRKRLAAFVLNDETYALISSQTGKSGFYPLMVSSGLATWSSWVLGTALGISLGQQLPERLLAELDVILVLTFLCLLVPGMNNNAHRATALIATLTISLCWHWPLGSDLLFAGTAGIFAGALVNHLQRTSTRMLEKN
ncbi:MAG: AzlC family ABC transporter permease [Marinobacterium sp.]|nr:AzlC family ABC transporter permease [Marinobacterium sp.]